MTVRVTHQRAKCIGCGSCVLEAPDVWSISEVDGLATLKDSVQKRNFFIGYVDESDRDAVKRSEDCCPVCIIKVAK